MLTREAALAEGAEGGFAGVYPVLKALEERGEIRRGYFVAGLGAAQFALPGAVDRLRDHRGGPLGGELSSADHDDEAVVLAATDPLALDLAALRLMGFDWRAIPKVREALTSATGNPLPVTEDGDPADVEVWEAAGAAPVPRPLSEIRCERPFRPHPGWRDHIEDKQAE